MGDASFRAVAAGITVTLGNTWRIGHILLVPARADLAIEVFLHPSAEHLTDIGQVFAAPEQLAAYDKGRDAEHPTRLGGTTDAVQLRAPRAFPIVGEPGRIGTRFCQHAADHRDIFDIELALPEAFEDRVVVAPKHRVALAFRMQHAGQGEARIPDLLRTADHQSAFARLAAAIHVAVAHSAPLMGVALLFDNAAALVEPGGAKEARNVEPIGQPIDAY